MGSPSPLSQTPRTRKKTKPTGRNPCPSPLPRPTSSRKLTSHLRGGGGSSRGRSEYKSRTKQPESRSCLGPEGRKGCPPESIFAIRHGLPWGKDGKANTPNVNSSWPQPWPLTRIDCPYRPSNSQNYQGGDNNCTTNDKEK